MKYRCLQTLIASFFSLVSNSFALDAYNPPAPYEWEKSVIPGFEPTIESVLIATTQGRKQFDAEVTWESWGAAAGPALMNLFGNSAWKDFRYTILKFMARSPYEEGESLLIKLAEGFISAEPFGDEENRWFAPVCRLIGSRNTESALEYFSELIQTNRAEVLKGILRGLSAFQDVGMLSRVLATYRRALTRLPAIERPGYEAALKHISGRIRANESMDIVLKQEETF